MRKFLTVFNRALSPEPPPCFGEGVLVDDDPFLDGLIRGEVVVFSLKLAVEPAGHLRVILPISASL